MLRRAWQGAMIGLARSQQAKAFMQGARATSFLASQFVAGRMPEDGLARALALQANAVRASLFYLGEYIASDDVIKRNVANKVAIADLLGRAGADVHISIDPTQIGREIGQELCRANLFLIAEAIARSSNNRSGVHCAMLDMEDESCVDLTMRLHREIQAAQLPAAITLQAYLRRTASDLEGLLDQGAKVRLVNGAFAAGGRIAFAARADVKANFRKLIAMLFSQRARDAGMYPSIATHDERLHGFAIECAEKGGWRPDEYEFEMLLGVRGDVAERLACDGRRVRLYVPFGEDWWPHAVRRIGESPGNALLLARAVMSNG